MSAMKPMKSERSENLAIPMAPGKLVERKAFTLEREGEGWIMVTLTYAGQMITGREATVPDIKAVAVERFKIAVARYWGTIG